MGERRGFSDFVDRLTSVAAIIAAMAAVCIAVYEAHIEREQQKKSVWPYLMQDNSRADQAYWRFVENVGLGPALVRSFEIRVGDSVYGNGNEKTVWRKVVKALTGSDTAHFLYTNLGNGSVLRQGQRTDVLKIPPGPAADSFFQHRGQLHTKACYCSLYGDCWIADSEHEGPRSVGSCPKEEPGS